MMTLLVDKTRQTRTLLIGSLLALWSAIPLCSAAPAVPKWSRFEQSFQSAADYANPIQEAALTVEFMSPSGTKLKAYGFWDGGKAWKVRFLPNEAGKWAFTTTCSNAKDTGLHGQMGSFDCAAPMGDGRFQKHGPLKVSADGFYLTHDDGTPFFWLADTAWNGALLSTPEEWQTYLKERSRQSFSAVQWVATQWRAAPTGDLNKQLAFTGRDKITVNPEFFQRLDTKADELNRAGLLNVPVLLWAIGSGANPESNPGNGLPEDQAILLARYMVARWQGNYVAWILPGDGHYFGQEGEKWKRIGRAVFGDIPHAPVSLHPQGRHWNWHDFKDESWMGIIGYQSGHGDSDEHLRWMTTEGPAVKDWKLAPHRPFINLEPAYENHLGYQSHKPISADLTRRILYWSLLNTPTAGVSYGGHGVWGWDDGTKPPTDHAGTGVPMAWPKALNMPCAQQMTNLASFFNSLEWWRLRPVPQAVVNNPGGQNPRKFVAAASTEKKDLTLVYVPEDRTIEIRMDALPASPEIRWFNPRTGEKSPAVAVVTDTSCQFPTPAEGDWILIMTSQEKAKAGQ